MFSGGTLDCVKIPAGRAENLAHLVSPLNFCCPAFHDEKQVGRIIEGTYGVAHRKAELRCHGVAL